LTDGQISSGKTNGDFPMKQLELWEPDGLEETDLHDLHSGLQKLFTLSLIMSSRLLF
jgi:hypothetical protein